jgi:TetR/AcrR family transcriptional repressor of nem operon
MRRHILSTARPIILGKGFAAVGINEILTAAGIPKGSFYHYFASKDNFGESLLEDYFTEYTYSLDQLLVNQPGTAATRLMSYWETWRKTQTAEEMEHKCLAVKLGAEVCDLSDTMRKVLKRGTDVIISKLSVCIEEGMRDRSIKGISDARRTGAQLYELWLGATLLEKIHRDGHFLDLALTSTKQILHIREE